MNKISYDMIYKAAWMMCVASLPLPIRITSACTVLLVVCWLCDPDYRARWHRVRHARWIIPFVAFFFLHVIGLFYSTDTKSALMELERKLSFLFIPLVAASGRPILHVDFTNIKRAFVYSCAAVVVGSFVFMAIHLTTSVSPEPSNFDILTNEQYHLLHPTSSALWEHFSYINILTWIGLHPAYFSMHLVFCIIILVSHMFIVKKMAAVDVALIILFVFFISLLSSRMAMISGVMVFILLGVFQLMSSGSFKSIGISIACLCLFAFFIRSNPVAQFRLMQEPRYTDYAITHDPIWNSVNARMLEWKSSLLELKNSWLLGVGSGDSQHVLQARYASFGEQAAVLNYNAHNQYLQTTLELGIVGLLALLLCLREGISQPWHLQSEHILFVLLVGTMCMTESILSAQKGIIFFVAFKSLYIQSRSLC